VQSSGNRIEDIRQSIFNSLNLYHHYDVEIERRINLLVELGELNQAEGTQLLGKLLTVSNQAQRAKEYFGEKIFDYFIDQKIPTKNDFQELIRKIDSISQRVDGLSLDGKSKL
jgi:polyhydroxyalkanoate synthesis regulator phasin